MGRRVAIIGAGMSGLIACKYTSENGFDPIVFEAKSTVGGVWNHTLETTKLQIPKTAYQFSDHPWPSSVTLFPDHNQVLEYFKSYACHFDLEQYIKFHSKVVAIDYDGPSDEEMVARDLWGGTGEPFSRRGRWNITVYDTQNQSTKIYQVEFVILCIGKYSDVPNIPDFPLKKGPEVFDGKVLHSMHYSAMLDASAAKLLQGKRVTVAGIQKSALDIATESAALNGVDHPCTLVYRNAHWSFPGGSVWGVPFAFLYLNRFSELMIHKPGEGLMLYLVAILLSPLRWFISKFVESYIRWTLPLKKYNMIPNHSFNKELSSCAVAAKVPDNFYDRVDDGSIILKKSTNFTFCKEGLMIDGNDAPLESDVVILATGYKSHEKLKNIFESSKFHKYMIGSSRENLSLYRECIHPRIPQMAIIGYSESLQNIHTSEMRCQWIAHLLKGTFKLPRITEMEEDVLRWEINMKQYSGAYYPISNCMRLLHIWYNDQLCKDMKCNPRRKKGFFAELFEPYGARDYVNLSPE